MKIAAIPAISAMHNSMTTSRKNALLSPGARPELRIPHAAAQTRIVSVVRIRLDSWKSVRPSKGIICDDISEFESSHDIPFGPTVVRAADGSPEVTAWVVIKPDDGVVIRIARSEMGQGSMTGLAQLVAEELECDWSKVSTEFPTPGQNLARNLVWGRQFTAGSRAIRESHEYVRKAGATARTMLIQAAANEWKVPAAECSASNSVITHRPSGRTTTYGKVTEAAAKIEPPKEVALKDAKDWKIAGKPLKRLDTLPKVTGEQVYGIDLKLPGMLCAAIKDCPVFGGKL